MKQQDYLKLLKNSKSTKFKTFQQTKRDTGFFSCKEKQAQAKEIIGNVLTNEHLYVRLQSHRDLTQNK